MGKQKAKVTTQRNRYSAEYRQEALLLAGKIGVAAAARELGLHDSQLYGWRAKAEVERSRSESEKQQSVEIVRLKRQLAEQSEELTILKKRLRTLLGNSEEAACAKYAFIDEHQSVHSVALMCLVLGVSRNSYYTFKKRRAQGRNHGADQAQIDEQVKVAFEAGKGRSGSPRLTLDLADQGHVMDRKTVAKSLNRQGLRAKAARKFRVTTDSKHSLPIHPNRLDQNFTACRINEKWVGDITYLATDEGWTYLATVIDLYSRKVVGWSMSARIQATLVCDALTMALWRRGFPTGVIMHTDRGSQYCSGQYQSLLTKHGLLCSMSGVGNCYDNACAESFFHTLKVECIHGVRFATRTEMRTAVFEYIELDYNRRRRHSSIGMISPDRFEAQQVA